ncbi:MAG: hypothetical protein M3347_09525, partial [Armatimonadota bacterium]|nr:hypothetical protein [Armatimonadota bacterium]
MAKLNLIKSLKSRAGVPGSPQVGTEKRRAAYAQPRVLVAMMATVLLVSTWWALAQREAVTQSSTQSATTSAATTSTAGTRKPVSWADLPQMVHEYGRIQAARALKQGSSGSGFTTSRFALTEVDLTPGNVSDERQPSYRPNGDFIAFTSNGVDADRNGRLDANAFSTNRRYHIWIMRRDGSGLRQVTGVTADDPAFNRDQFKPSWSPDGNRIVYFDGAFVNGAAPGTTQLFIVTPFSSTVGTQITFGPGQKFAPAWNPTGTAIAFSTNVSPVDNTALGQFDIFSIDPSGGVSSVRRLTGGSNDTLGNSTQDMNPAFSLVNSGVMFFSSNRQGTAVLSAGRR